MVESHEVVLVVKGYIVIKATWARVFISDDLMSITCNSANKSNIATFRVACALSFKVPNSWDETDMFWAELDSSVNQGLNNDDLGLGYGRERKNVKW